MSNEYINSPFTTHDGTDAQGVRAEVRVSTGFALVSDLSNPKRRDSPMVKFGFSTEDSQYPTQGWVNKETDEEIYTILKNAYDNQEAVGFRIEVQRKKNVDRSIPIADISKEMKVAFENTFRYVVAVRTDESEDWVVGSHMVTLFAEDPTNGATKATASDLEKPVPQKSGNEGIPQGSSPYCVLDKDGEVNPNSFALSAAVKMYLYIRETVDNLESGRDDWEGKVFTPEEVDKIFRMAIRVTSNIQKFMTNKPVDMNSYSYRTAEDIVKGVMEHHAPLHDFKDDFDRELKEYFKKVNIFSKKIARNSLDVVAEIHSPYDDDDE